MKTPIFDFVRNYVQKGACRLHMPGHKGTGPLGFEQFDITEIDGADVLYHENGILKESQDNASQLFGSARTLYSTEGATLCIRAMLAMVKFYSQEQGKKPIIAACRNAHKAFITGCALTDLDPIWITPSSNSLLTGKLTENDLLHFLDSQTEKPIALYLTSPDYLGQVTDLRPIVRICRENNILLLVDNAHGAYLHFLPDSCHPLDLGADVVCDSAHKTLPVLTGGAYLHISKSSPKVLSEYASQAMSLFASSSPSYLILQSLDLCNRYLDGNYKRELYEFAAQVWDLKKELRRSGFSVLGDEPLKITVQTKTYGYRGTDFSSLLQEKNLFVEFADPDYVVLMLTPEQGSNTLERILKVFDEIPMKEPVLEFPPKMPPYKKVIPPREALISNFEKRPTKECEGRILAQPGVTCPPAVPVAICGEKLTDEHLYLLSYYGIDEIYVVK